jgi:hypothetical protein
VFNYGPYVTQFVLQTNILVQVFQWGALLQAIHRNGKQAMNYSIIFKIIHERIIEYSLVRTCIMIYSVIKRLKVSLPVPLAAWSSPRIVLHLPNTEIVGSNPSRGTDVCLRLSVLCCPVKVQALAMGRSPSKESYKNVKNVHRF